MIYVQDRQLPYIILLPPNIGEHYNQFKDGFLTLTQFVSDVGQAQLTDDERYYLLYAFVNLDEAQAAHKILDTRMPRNLKEVK